MTARLFNLDLVILADICVCYRKFRVNIRTYVCVLFCFGAFLFIINLLFLSILRVIFKVTDLVTLSTGIVQIKSYYSREQNSYHFVSFQPVEPLNAKWSGIDFYRQL